MQGRGAGSAGWRPGPGSGKRGAGRRRAGCERAPSRRGGPDPRGRPQVWEALLTLVFFPVCVVFAWMADKRLLFYKYVYKRYRTDPRSGIIIGAEGDPPKSIELDGTFLGAEAPGEVGGLGPGPAEARELDTSRREVIQILKDLKQKHPDKDLEQLVGIANYYALLHQQKSRAFYRIQATRLMTGAGNVLRRHAVDASRRATLAEGPGEDEDDGASRIFFEPSLYHCLENCGSVLLSVTCQGGEGNSTFYVDYRTEDGSAKAGSDYEYRWVPGSAPRPAWGGWAGRAGCSKVIGSAIQRPPGSSVSWLPLAPILTLLWADLQYSFIHSLLRVYFVPGTVLGIWQTLLDKTDSSGCPPTTGCSSHGHALPVHSCA